MNQHNPFMYVEIAWIMIMFNNSHYLLFHFFSYIFLLLLAFFLHFLFIYIISFIDLVLVSLFLFHIIIVWHVFFYCFSFMFVFIVLLFLLSYYLFLLSFAFCFFLLFLFFLIFISIILHYSIIHYSPHKLDCVLSYWFNYQKPLFTIHHTNWIVSYHIDSIIKRKYVGICFDSLCFLYVSLWFICPLISFTISILANNNRINHVYWFETTIQILQIIVS